MIINMKKIFFMLFIIALIRFVFFKGDSIRLGSGIFAPEVPEQEKIVSSVSFSYKDYTISPLAKFTIEAKVLSRKNYSYGREAELSPLDLALGWGDMSDEVVLDEITITQGNRWYRWRVEEFPIPRREIETQSANMHLIPANESVESMMNHVRKGDIIKLSGNLVRVDADDGWYWISSLTRSDTGSHACEVIWVEDLKIKNLSIE
jgi:hypothetical protein